MAHANVERLRSFLDAFAARDAERIRVALAPVAVWHVGGTHRFSGDYRGIEEIVRRACRDRSTITVTLDRRSDRITGVIVHCC